MVPEVISKISSFSWIFFAHPDVRHPGTILSTWNTNGIGTYSNFIEVSRVGQIFEYIRLWKPKKYARNIQQIALNYWYEKHKLNDVSCALNSMFFEYIRIWFCPTLEGSRKCPDLRFFHKLNKNSKQGSSQKGLRFWGGILLSIFFLIFLRFHIKIPISNKMKYPPPPKKN